MNKPLNIEIAIGYMLKVMRAKIDFSKHDKEFKAIRHGRYDDFIDLIGADKPFMVVYNEGVVKTDNISQEQDGDFAGLLSAGPSLVNFCNDCFATYGKVVDEMIPDFVYYHMVMFELGLRMHARNAGLVDKWAELKIVIEALADHKELKDHEKSILHQGRRFVNKVKHGKKILLHHFEGFKQACILLQEKELIVGVGSSFSKKIA
ncbi:MAG: hypothetical protein ACK5ZT_15150 [Sphingobacteriaceae bacterium]